MGCCSMSTQRSDDGLNAEDIRILRLYKVIACEGYQALLKVFTWGCKKNDNESLITFLKNKGMSQREVKSRFDKTMRIKLEEDSTGSSYDVSLLWSCIKFGCEGLATDGSPVWNEEKDDKVESLCTFVKNFRNRLVHGQRIEDKTKLEALCLKLKEKLEKLITLAGNKYEQKSEVDEEIMAMKENVNKIMNTPMLDISLYQEELKKLREEQRDIVRKVGSTELPKCYETMSRVDPASFITGKERLNVKQVFTQLEVVHEEKEAGATDEIDYRTLLNLKTDEGKQPAVVVVEGDAGAGKTTLSKLILNNWADMKINENKPDFQGLDEYDLLLYAQGRNKIIKSFADLLTVLMPQAAAKLTKEDLVHSVLNLKVLLIIDGLDELNLASKALITDLFDYHLEASDHKLQLLMTTRPQMLLDLSSIIKSHPMIHTRLKGISPDKWEDFVFKLHNEMIKEGQSKQNTDLLVDYVRQSRAQLGEHYRLPLNLTLLTYLWAANPECVNSVTTATGLYLALHDLVKSRLVERLQDHDSSHPPKTELQSLCKKFLQELYNACLETLLTGYVQLSEKAVNMLHKKCSDLGLQFEEMTAPFLSVDKEWSASGYILDLFVPHKSIMEFYAAHRFLHLLMGPPGEEGFQGAIDNFAREIKITMEEEDRKALLSMFKDKINQQQSLLSLIKIILKKDLKDDSLSQFQNMFLHLGGLLAHQENQNILLNCAQDLVTALEKADVKGSKWLDLVVETKCNEEVARLVAEQDITKLGVRDGHTGAALALFPHLWETTPVEIILETEVCFVPLLEKLLEKVAQRPCKLDIILKHQWKNRNYGQSDILLAPVLLPTARCTLVRLTGYLQDLTRLPDSVMNLRISFTDDAHAKTLISQLHNRVHDYLGSSAAGTMKPAGIAGAAGVVAATCTVRPAGRVGATGQMERQEWWLPQAQWGQQEQQV